MMELESTSEAVLCNKLREVQQSQNIYICFATYFRHKHLYLNFSVNIDSHSQTSQPPRRVHGGLWAEIPCQSVESFQLTTTFPQTALKHRVTMFIGLSELY
jgi:hypothetical protein